MIIATHLHLKLVLQRLPDVVRFLREGKEGPGPGGEGGKGGEEGREEDSAL